MAVYTLEISDAAEADLEDIFDYLAQRNIVAARKIVGELSDKSHMLTDGPLIGAAREDIGPGVRHLVVAPYLILYRVRGRTVQIIRYIHGARDVRDI